MNRTKYLISTLTVLAALLMIGAGCDGPAAPVSAVDPDSVEPTWQAQSCRATVKAKANTVNMDISGRVSNLTLNIDTEYMFVQGALLTFIPPGKAVIDYGGGAKVNVYAPPNGAGKLEVKAWNGSLQLSVIAISGSSTSTTKDCKIEWQSGKVKLAPKGTDFVFIHRPTTLAGEEVQLAVFEGEVDVLDINDNFLTSVAANQAVIVTEGRASPPFPIPDSRENTIRNLEAGRDLFGNPQDNPEPAAPGGAYENDLRPILEELSAAYPDSRFVIVAPIGQEPAFESIVSFAAERGIEVVPIIGPQDEVFNSLAIRQSAGELNDDLIFLVNAPPEWQEQMWGVASDFKLESRTYDLTNGQIRRLGEFFGD
jgi:hypothetical protein